MPALKQETQHFRGGRFYNEDQTVQTNVGLRNVIRWLLSRSPTKWTEWVDDNAQPDLTPPTQNEEASVTFINHATVLIQLFQLNVLTDPVFSKRASPLRWWGPKRHRSPGVLLPNLPKVDIVVISHNHYDHMDIASLIALDLKDQPHFFVPLGNKKFLERAGIKNITELDWWESTDLSQGGRITLVPMQHWSARGLWDHCQALWGGFVIQATGLQILFAGDTGYNQHFKHIASKLGPMDVSLLPIGAYEPRWFMKNQHMNPHEAVQAHIDLKSQVSIGIHFRTFDLADEGMEAPIDALKDSLINLDVDPATFYTPKNGETISFKGRVIRIVSPKVDDTP